MNTDNKIVVVTTIYDIDGPMPVRLQEYLVSNREKSVLTSVLKATDKLWIVPLGPKGDEACKHFTSLEEAVAYIDSVNN